MLDATDRQGITHTHIHTHNLWYYGNPEHVNPSLNFKKRIENVTLPYQKRVVGGKEEKWKQHYSRVLFFPSIHNYQKYLLD